MGFFDDLVNGATAAVQAVVDAAEETAAVIGDTIKAVVDALTPGDDTPSEAPPEHDPTPPNPVLDAIVQNADAFVGTLIAPFRDAYVAIRYSVSAAVKQASGDEEGATTDLTAAQNAARNVTGDVVLGPVSLGMMVAVNYITAAQRIVGIEGKARPLTATERALLIPIFQGSVNYDAVTVEEGNVGVLGITQSGAFTIGHRIRVVDPGSLPLSGHQDLLVHEMVHVWQFQNGGSDYICQSLVAQMFGSTSPVAPSPGYDFDNAVAAGKSWPDFNCEQQAQFIEAAYSEHVDFADPNTMLTIGGTDYTSHLKTALWSIRNGVNTPHIP